MKRFPLLLFLFLILVGCHAGRQGAATPPIPSSTPDPNFPLLESWCIAMDTKVSIPTYHRGLIYVITEGKDDEDQLVALDKTGAVQWAKVIKNEGSTIGNPGYWIFLNNYFVVGTFSSVTVLNATTGDEIWSKRILTNSGIAVGGDKVFVSAQDAVIAFGIDNGDPIWRIEGQGREAPMPLYVPEKNLVVIDHKTYRLVDAETGSVVLERVIPYDHEIFTSLYKDQAVVTNDKYLRTMTQGIEVIDLLEGKKAYLLQGTYSPLPRPPFLTNNVVFLNAYAGIKLYDLDQEDFVWSTRFALRGEPLEVYGNPILVAEKVYVLLSDATIRALDYRTGEAVGQWQGKQVEKMWGTLSPYIPGFDSGDNMLFVSFGTNEICAFQQNN